MLPFFPGSYLPRIRLKSIMQKHMRYCDLKRGQTIVIERKDAETRKAVILDMCFDGISVKLEEDGSEKFFRRADYGFTWRSWWRRPTNQERLTDSWK